jgi:hypothetical protein
LISLTIFFIVRLAVRPLWLANAKAKTTLTDEELTSDYACLYRNENKLILFIDSYFDAVDINEEEKKKTLTTLKRNFRTKCDMLFATIATTVYGTNTMKTFLASTRTPKNTTPVAGANTNTLERFGGDASAADIRASNAIASGNNNSSSSSASTSGRSVGSKKSTKRAKSTTLAPPNTSTSEAMDQDGEEVNDESLDFLNANKSNADEDEDEDDFESDSTKFQMLSS